MLSRMIVRLLFKACLSLGLLLGVVSYGHYLSGGDPGAVWSRVAGGALDGVTDSWSGLRDKARATAAAVPSALPGGDAGGNARRDSVWTWRDADGVLHYASAPPADADATRLTVDPDVNVLAPVAPPTVPDAPVRHARTGASGGARSASASTGSLATGVTRGGARGAREAVPVGDDALPGIAGAILNARGDAPAPDPARAEALLRLLQPTSR